MLPLARPTPAVNAARAGTGGGESDGVQICQLITLSQKRRTEYSQERKYHWHEVPA